jgi:drug/metabolite transporter (DMT)-like permease
MNRTGAILLALATAMFWGLYGPAVAVARSKDWSPFKPYVFIGLAYLAWGCIVGALAMRQLGDSFSFTGDHFKAAKWGFIGGSLGAFGALTLTCALFVSKGNFGLVMPFVFGGAVTMTAIVNVIQGKASHNPLLWVGMVLVLCGIILVAMYSHDAHPPSPTAATGATSSDSPAESEH